MDPATAMILQEIGKLGMNIVNSNNNKIIITPEDFKRFWKKVNKFTSSLMCGVHYGHYKAAIQDALSTKVLALQLTVIAQRGIPPESWSVGLQVMLEKIAGVCLVEKLCAVQLYEADFNCYNQIIIGRQAMQMLINSGYIPEELFSQKGSTAKDAKFDKTLMADLSQQARQPMTVVSADAAYCYNRVNHIIMSLVWLVLTHKQHTGHSHGATMPTNNEILPEDRLWQIQDILWRHQSSSLYDGSGPREQGSATFVDSTQRGISGCLQTT